MFKNSHDNEYDLCSLTIYKWPIIVYVIKFIVT